MVDDRSQLVTEVKVVRVWEVLMLQLTDRYSFDVWMVGNYNIEVELDLLDVLDVTTPEKFDDNGARRAYPARGSVVGAYNELYQSMKADVLGVSLVRINEHDEKRKLKTLSVDVIWQFNKRLVSLPLVEKIDKGDADAGLFGVADTGWTRTVQL